MAEFDEVNHQGPPAVTKPPVQTENKTRIQRPMMCKVLLLNGEDYEVAIDKRSIGQLLYERVCDYVDLLERDYFGLLYKDERDSNSVKYWLDLNKKIKKQKRRGKMNFEFALKFYPPDPTQLTESITRYLVCLQIRRDIISGKLPCSQATHAMLGSYAVQADVGDYDPIDHGTGIDYIRDMPFAPDQTDDLLYKIAALHKQHKGQTPEQAELHYLEYSKKIALYGIDLHKAKDSDYVDIFLGVGATGISVYRDNLRINRFVWPKILKISYRRNKFLLRIRPAEFETFESWIAFRLPSNKQAKRLWKISVEHHAFLRLRSADDAKKRAGFPRFGSKYRYSGRTLYQTRLNASMADRPSKHFERTHSRQSLNSVLNNNKTRSLDQLNIHRGPYFEHPLDIKNTSFDLTNQGKLDVSVAPSDEDRTPLQSPLPHQESPKFVTREIVRHNTLREEDEYDDDDMELPEAHRDSPRESPQEERRIIINHQSVRHQNHDSGSESDRSYRGSMHSLDFDDDMLTRVKPEVAPKPEVSLKVEVALKPEVAPKPSTKPPPPPVAKKPEKPSKKEKTTKPEKPPKAEKPPKPVKPPKAEKPPKADKSPKTEKPKKAEKSSKKDKGNEKEKEPVRELSM